MSNLPAKKKEAPKPQRFTDEQREHLFRLKTTETNNHTVLRKFNDEWYGPGEEGKRETPLSYDNMKIFFRGKHAKEEFSRFLEHQIYHIRELPFASPAARIQKLAEIITDDGVATREKLVAIQQIHNETKYLEEKAAANRPEPLIALRMEAIDDEDPLIDTKHFSRTKQIALQLIEHYGGAIGSELHKLIKEFKDNGGLLPGQEEPVIIEAQITDGNK